MRDYLPKSWPYGLPRTLYRRLLAIVRDFPRMIEERKSLDMIGDLTEAQQLYLDRLHTETQIVLEALSKLPECYRMGVLDNILHDVPLSELGDASEKTWSRWKNRFLYELAIHMHMIG